MSATEPIIRNISDTACWAAVYRARETERSDSLFRDPFARRLAGARGEQIAQAMPEGNKLAWPWVMRTVLYDEFILGQINQGADLVLNLAAGLDSRPYRMQLSSSLQWVEVDLPEILTYKEQILASEKPTCALERVRLDLANLDARRELFTRLGKRCQKALIITEGLLIYLTADEVGAFARDLAAPASFQRWIVDLASPGLLQMLQRTWNAQLGQAGSPLKFGPEEGPEFFTLHGWKPIDVRSLLRKAARLKRVSLFMRLLALMPESKGRQGNRPWGGVCLLAKQ
jgi:methyltransferase (TIGR00027 family)